MSIENPIYIKRSQVTGKKYDYFGSDIIRIVNIYQAMAYISNGAEVIDIYTSYERETNKPILVFVFNKEQTKPLFDAWCKHELEIKNEQF